MFYYKYTDNGTQAQRVDYNSHCFPFANARSVFESKPCRLYFVGGPKIGIYLHQPAHNVDCCQFVAGVGTVPPQFLRAYTYKGTNMSAPDMYGNNVSCDYCKMAAPPPALPLPPVRRTPHHYTGSPNRVAPPGMMGHSYRIPASY